MTNPTTIARHRRDQRDGGQRQRRLRAGPGPDQPRRAPCRAEYKGAIVVQTEAGTGTNAATITAGGSTNSAILPAAGFANRVIVDPGAVFVGTVSGGTPGLGTLELASSASIGAVIGFASRYLRFGALIFDASSHWPEEADTDISVPIRNGFGASGTTVLTRFAAISKTFASNPLVLSDSGGGHVLFKQRCRRASNWAGSLNQ